MGVSISWLAIKGKNSVALLEELGLKPTGATGDFLKFKMAGQALPGGWHLLTLKGCDHPLQSAKRLTELSADRDVLACSVEEHVMYAMATLWRDGREIWRIEHHGDRVREDLKVTGKPPEEFEAIRSDYAVKQKSDGEVDWYFEMPVELAKRMTGFKHDESNEALDDKFEELKGMVQAEAAGRRSWWKFW